MVVMFDSSTVQSVRVWLMIYHIRCLLFAQAVDEWRVAYEESMRGKIAIPMVLLAHKSDIGTPVIKPMDLDSVCRVTLPRVSHCLDSIAQKEDTLCGTLLLLDQATAYMRPLIN